MQLNNSSNNRVAKIDKIDIYQKLIIFSIYEFGINSKKIEQNSIVSSENLQNLLNMNVNFNEKCLRILKDELLTGYELSDDEKNWAIKIGSGGNNTTIRVFIPYSLIGKITNTNNTLELLILKMKDLSAFKIDDITGAIQYLEYIEDADLQILETYPEIIIQYK